MTESATDAVSSRRAAMFGQRSADDGTKLRLTVGVLIRNAAGAVLLEKRRDCGLWCVPGGRVEPGESLQATAAREVFEETGLRITVTRLVGVYSGPEDHILTFPDGVVQTVDVMLAADIAAGELRVSDESETLRFFDEHRLPPDDEIVPAARRVLGDYFGGLSGVVA